MPPDFAADRDHLPGMEEDDTGRGGSGYAPADPDARAADVSYNSEGGEKAAHPAEYYESDKDSKDVSRVD